MDPQAQPFVPPTSPAPVTPLPGSDPVPAAPMPLPTPSPMPANTPISPTEQPIVNPPEAQQTVGPDLKSQVVERLKSANNVLVTVGTNPSVDALASALGLTLMLDKLDKHATTVFSGDVPRAIEFLDPEATFENNVDSLREFIIALDKEKADKLRYKVEEDVVRIFITPYKTSISEKDLKFSQGDFNVDVVVALGVTQKEDLDKAITAHGRILHDATVITVNAGEQKSSLGSIDWNEPSASSIAEMLVGAGELLGDSLLNEQISTAFLTGIVASTNRFSNEKTSPKVMTLSAQLMAAGANQQLIASNLRQDGILSESVREPGEDHATNSEMVVEHTSKNGQKDEESVEDEVPEESKEAEELPHLKAEDILPPSIASDESDAQKDEVVVASDDIEEKTSDTNNTETADIPKPPDFPPKIEEKAPLVDAYSLDEPSKTDDATEKAEASLITNVKTGTENFNEGTQSKIDDVPSGTSERPAQPPAFGGTLNALNDEGDNNAVDGITASDSDNEAGTTLEHAPTELSEQALDTARKAVEDAATAQPQVAMAPGAGLDAISSQSLLQEDDVESPSAEIPTIQPSQPALSDTQQEPTGPIESTTLPSVELPSQSTFSAAGSDVTPQGNTPPPTFVAPTPPPQPTTPISDFMSPESMPSSSMSAGTFGQSPIGAPAPNPTSSGLPPLPPLPPVPTGNPAGLPPLPITPGQAMDATIGFQPQATPAFMQDMPVTQNPWTQAADEVVAKNQAGDQSRQQKMDQMTDQYNAAVDRNRELQGLDPISGQYGANAPNFNDPHHIDTPPPSQ